MAKTEDNIKCDLWELLEKDNCKCGTWKKVVNYVFQLVEEERADERGKVKKSLANLEKCANDIDYDFDTDNFDLVMCEFDWIKEQKNE